MEYSAGIFRFFCEKIPPEFTKRRNVPWKSLKSGTFFCFPCFFNFFCKYMSDQCQKQKIMKVLAEIFRMLYKLSCKKVKIQIKLYFYAIYKNSNLFPFTWLFIHHSKDLVEYYRYLLFLTLIRHIFSEKIQKTWKTKKSSGI